MLVGLEGFHAVDGGGGHADAVECEELGDDRHRVGRPVDLLHLHLVRVRVKVKVRVRVRFRVRVRVRVTVPLHSFSMRSRKRGSPG